MQLNDDQTDKLLTHLRTKWPGNRPCASCGKVEWEISDRIWELREFFGGGMVLGGSIYPVIAMTCRACASTVFLNAILIGLIERASDSVPQATPAEQPK
jgi:hypothetical protein